MEMDSKVKGNSDREMVSSMSNTFSAMLDLADSSSISEGGVIRDKF